MAKKIGGEGQFLRLSSFLKSSSFLRSYSFEVDKNFECGTAPQQWQMLVLSLKPLKKLTGTNSRQTDGQTDRRTDGQDHVLSQADALTKKIYTKYFLNVPKYRCQNSI